MWVAKLVIPANEGMLLGSMTKKHKVGLMGYPLSHFFRGKTLHVLISAFLVGASEAKGSLIEDMKHDKRSAKIDMMTDNFGFWLIQQHPGIQVLFDPMIIYLKPIIVSKDGDYVFEIASWEKAKLTEAAKVILTKEFGGKLVSIKNKKIINFNILTAVPNLSDQQEKALEIAIENGYYGYPRKIESQELAKIMKISPSTYQFHLRNAEKKIMPFMHRNLS